MRSGEIAVLLLLLVAAFIVGNVWFHFVEAILSRIKKWFARGKKPPAWHTLPPDEEDRKDG